MEADFTAALGIGKLITSVVGIERALRRVLAERGEGSAWCVEDLTGLPMDLICTDYPDRGRPVLFWACIDMKEPVTGPDWYLEDGTGKSTGDRNRNICFSAPSKCRDPENL